MFLNLIQFSEIVVSLGQFNSSFILVTRLMFERKKFKKTVNWLTIIFGQRTFFPIIKLVFREKREFYLFFDDAIFKDRVLFK